MGDPLKAADKPQADLPREAGASHPGLPDSPEPMSWRRRATRWWYVLRYYRTSQLAMRLLSRLRGRLLSLGGRRGYAEPPERPPLLRDNPGLSAILGWKLAGRDPQQSAGVARGVLVGRYRFLNQECALPDPPDWRLEDNWEVGLLWRFHLHYHEFLLDLAAEGQRSGDDSWLERVWQLVSQWIDGNRPTDRRVFQDAWHPYCISRRLPVWLMLFPRWPPPDRIADRVLKSILLQARFLEDHLEWDLRGNHLLENARALVLAGAFFSGPDAERWLRCGARVFQSQVAAQILPHGEHFERAPMYHAQMLEAALDVRDAVESIRPDLADCCGSVAARMASLLEEILHPDGGIPLLGDSSLGQSPPPDQLIARAAGGQVPDLPSRSSDVRRAGKPAGARTIGDYWTYREGERFLLFDAGPVGADELPAHAHADLLTCEASAGGRRLFVDSGVFSYEDDQMRRYCRSTAAHNVLEIDGANQCDVWSRFRMGRRGWPRKLESGKTDTFHWARAVHNAYRHLGVPLVGRWIACSPGGPWFSVSWARGKGRHKLRERLHLHPDVEAERTASNQVRLALADLALWLIRLDGGCLTLSSGWYCPEFGRRLECPVVEWGMESVLPWVSGWCLLWEADQGAAILDRSDPGKTMLRWSTSDQHLELHPLGEGPLS